MKNTKKNAFYAQSGGQEADTGIIFSDKSEGVVVSCWKTQGGLFIHKIKILSGELNVGDEVSMEVNLTRRNKLRQNHSATHVLHQVFLLNLFYLVQFYQVYK